MRGSQTILSAGIDIGTSTTKLIISELLMQNTAGQTQVPRIEITEQKLVYKSPIFRTPLLDEQTINVKEVEKIVFNEYQQAQISADQIQTGAILITGETATKTNARELIHSLSDAAGDFLVATAGPDLESILASYGSGAKAYSEKTGKVVANIDIGGGTTNIAVLKRGEVIGTATLHIGGRLISYKDGKVAEIAPSIQRLIKKFNRSYTIGDAYKVEEQQFVIQQMMRSLNNVLRGSKNQEDIPLLLGHLPDWEAPIETILFSGGVAQCIYPQSDGNCDMGVFNDIGQEIAKACIADNDLQHFEWVQPIETVRATVMGAGAHSTDVSGATIEVDASVLPLKNVPVLQCSLLNDSNKMAEEVTRALQKGVQLFDSEQLGEPFALYLHDIPYLNFEDIISLAHIIATRWPENNQYILLILEADYAKVLGQTLLSKVQSKQIVCIDQVFVRTGDYIDIGKPLEMGVVPVIVKTLAFHRA